MSNSIVASKRDFDEYVQYDSDIIPTEDNGIAVIKIPEDGIYYVSLHNIGLKFPDAYTPDIYAGYLRICSTQEKQKGIIQIAGLKDKQAGVYFPLREPGTSTPKCKIYNRFFFRVEDSVKFTFRDKNLDKVTMDRIVVTIHIVSNLRNMYID